MEKHNQAHRAAELFKHDEQRQRQLGEAALKAEGEETMPEIATPETLKETKWGRFSESGFVKIGGQRTAVDFYSQDVDEQWVRFNMIDQETGQFIDSGLFPTWEW